MKLKIDNKVLIKILLSFYALSVFLDLHIFYNSISTLIRALFISFMFIIVIINQGNFKEKKSFIIYGVIILLYILGHHLNALNFKSFVPGNFNYNFISECLYFYKMITNVLLFYIVYKLNIRYKDIKNYLKVIILFMSLSIVISDLLGLSYTAYNFYQTKIPMYRWFGLETYDFIAASSKGFFHMTNQIVAIFLLYLPLSCYEAFKSRKIHNYLLILLIVLSMLMIGNRLAVYGTILELIVISFIYFLLNIHKRVNLTFYLFNAFIVIAMFMIIPHSPLSMRNIYYDAIYNGKPLEFINKKNMGESYEAYKDIPDDFSKRLEEKEVDSLFSLNAYPYQYDKKFWEDILKNDTTLTGNARFIELSIVKRVKEINHNYLDNLFGLTYTRIMNIFNIEKDFVMQFYSIGILGCLLFLGFYIIAFIYIGIKILFAFKDKFNEKNIALAMGTLVVLVAAYFSGNLLNSISIIIPLSFMISILINEVRSKQVKKEKERILGFDVSCSSKRVIVDNIFACKDQRLFVVNINPLIVLDHYKDEKKKQAFNEQLIQIPDGEGIVLLSKLRGGHINKRIAGIDLMLDICKKSLEKKEKIYLYGAKKGVALKAQEQLLKRFKGLNIVGVIDGYTKEEEVLQDINKKKPDILFVALGSPLQEDFILKNKDKLKSVKVFVPVGGSFDVISGNLKRAPKVFQKLKLEWLYRMIKEPKRFKGLFRLVKFIGLGIIYQEEPLENLEN